MIYLSYIAAITGEDICIIHSGNVWEPLLVLPRGEFQSLVYSFEKQVEIADNLRQDTIAAECKCKNCGASLTGSESWAMCEYCGSAYKWNRNKWQDITGQELWPGISSGSYNDLYFCRRDGGLSLRSSGAGKYATWRTKK